MYMYIYILCRHYTDTRRLRSVHTNALPTVAHNIPKIVQTLPTELVTVNSL